MALKIKPLADRVVVEPDEAQEVSAGGIILPDTAQEKPQQGKVVAVGPGKVSDAGTLIESAVKKGDTVLYGKYSGTEVTIDGTEYSIMRESDIPRCPLRKNHSIRRIKNGETD
jgi:chaperonin GroES